VRDLTDNRAMDMDDNAYRAIETRDRRCDGRLFVAVTTTGVYCRPFCPAPTPKRENVRFFPTAAAAPLDLGLTHAFPTPRQLAQANLAATGVPEPTRTAVSSLAQAVVADPLIFGPRRSLDDAVVQLRSLAGMDEWTAEYVAMRDLREPDAFPEAGIGMVRLATGEPLSPAELLARAERWRPWRAYAALHLRMAEPNLTSSIERTPDDREAA
jgi:3-methyladenine DNA glycosylase/8-oxoguanine DNA glycosylase